MSTIAAAAEPSRHERIHLAVLDAAERVFLRDGYVGASMDEVAKLAGASKQTVYKHFGSKEQLFVELVTSMTVATGDAVGHESSTEASIEASTERPIASTARAMDAQSDAQSDTPADIAETLTALALGMLDAVLTPRILRLRRLVIGESGRFPELGRALFEHGPARAIAGVERRLAAWIEAGALPPHDAAAAAQHYNWLVMGAPLNAAMLLGDDAIPTPAQRRAHATAAVGAFLRSVGATASPAHPQP